MRVSGVTYLWCRQCVSQRPGRCRPFVQYTLVFSTLALSFQQHLKLILTTSVIYQWAVLSFSFSSCAPEFSYLSSSFSSSLHYQCNWISPTSKSLFLSLTLYFLTTLHCVLMNNKGRAHFFGRELPLVGDWVKDTFFGKMKILIEWEREREKREEKGRKKSAAFYLVHRW